MRMTLLLAAPLLVIAAPSNAQGPTVIDVHLSNFRFTPSTILLDHGRPYVLRLINDAKGGHDLTAPAFFAAANVAAGDRASVQEGEVEVPPHETRTIHLTAPGTGSYPVKCSHAFHKAFGMKGKIVVR